MRRFYCPSKNITKNEISITDKKEIRHIKESLRLESGALVEIFDERGREFEAELGEFLPSGLSLKIKAERLPVPSPNKITVACAIPKNVKMDDIVDKLTQLGVAKIIPMKTKRVEVKLDKHKEALRRERWMRIALSACKQSKRSLVPLIDDVKELKTVLSGSKEFDLKLVPTLLGERKSLKEAAGKGNFKNALALIGPEGDFSDEEVRSAVEAGCIPVTLGKTVLRVDTAAIAVASFLRFFVG